jgi:hypothetical protein
MDIVRHHGDPPHETVTLIGAKIVRCPQKEPGDFGNLGRVLVQASLEAEVPRA